MKIDQDANRKAGFSVRTLRDGRARRTLGLGFCLALSIVSGEASAEWKVSDKDTHDKLEDVKKKLDKIYDQSNLKGDTFDPDKHKSLTLQYGKGESGSAAQDQESGALKKRTAEDSIEDRCGSGGSGTDASSVVGAVLGSSSEDSGTNPESVCKDLVEHQNKLFNYLLDMLELAKERQAELKEITDERKNITDNAKDNQMGAIESNTNRLLALQAQMQIDRMNMDLTVASYDRYFEGRNSQLADIQRKLQRGGGMTLTGAAVNVARNVALKAALDEVREYSN